MALVGEGSTFILRLTDAMIGSLPIDVLELITEQLEASDVAKLVVCGNGLLSKKLANGGVVRFSMDWQLPSWVAWPSRLMQLFRRMAHLSITSQTLCPSMNLVELPRSLLSLELRTLDLFVQIRLQKINLAILLPSLTSLGLSGSRLREDMLHNLPPNLTRLSLEDDRAFLLSSAFLHHLPQTLVSLELRFTYSHDDESALFPPNLEKLEIRVDCSVDLVCKFPPLLTDLSVRYRGFGVSTMDAHNNIDRKPWYHRLQLPNLKSLSIGGGVLSLADLALLPPSLTFLSTYLQDIVDDEHAHLIPRGLKRIEKAWAHLTEDGHKKLPSCLEYFLCDTVLPMTASLLTSPNLSLLGPNLTIMRIIDGPFFDGDEDQIEPSQWIFPPRLVELRLPYLNDTLCRLLPRTLEILACTHGTITHEGTAALPKSLRDSIISPSAFADNSALTHLSHLQSVQWHPNDQSAAPRITPTCFQDLQPGLLSWKHLTYICYDQPAHSCPLFATPTFGRSLQRLICLESLLISFERPEVPCKLTDFRFPNSLRVLLLRGFPTIPTATQMKIVLPPRLTDLSMRWPSQKPCRWGNRTLAALPRSLIYLSLGSFPQNLNLNRIGETLPPYLITFDINDTPVRGFQSPMVRFYGAPNM